MKTITEFIKATLAGGMFVLLPVALLYLLLGELFDLAIAVATPITLLFPEGQFDQAQFPALLAIGLILGASLILGLVIRSPFGNKLGLWIERRVLQPVPGYEFLKSLVQSLGNTSRARGFRPALKRLPGGGYQTAYVVEDPGNGWMTILLPHSPTAMAGPVELVPAEQVEILETGFGSFMQTLNHWGVGIQELAPPLSPSSKSKQP